MFDPQKAALLILAKGKGESAEESGPTGKEAFAAMMNAFKDGDTETAYDAFRAAVESCAAEETPSTEGE